MSNTTIPFNKLTASDANVRSTRNAEGIEALAASILAQGLLQNLVGYQNGKGVAVVAGGRRLAALSLLVERGQLPADHPVPVHMIEKQDSTGASLTENVQREAMHAADEFDAFQKLVNEKWTIDRIADAFGVTPLVVERRLKLAKAAPALIEQFRNNELSTDQLIALCATDDHERQVSVWESSRHYEWMASPKALRRAVLGEEIDATNDERVKFLGGLSVYEQAGGKVRRDLFSHNGDGGFIDDEALLDKLVADKLESEAAALRAEGWSWVESWPEFDFTAYHRFGRAQKTVCELPEDAHAKVEALKAEHAKLQAEDEQMQENAPEHGDFDEEQSARLDTIWERMEEIDGEVAEIEDAHATYAPEVLAKAGAVVAFDNGKVRIERGLVRTADRKAIAEATGDKGAVTGGRESEPAGRKSDALSDALRRSLLGHRNLAAQIVTAEKPDAAKLLLACWTVKHIRSECGNELGRSDAPTDFAISSNFNYGTGTRTAHPITDEAGKEKEKAFEKQALAAVAKLPKADGPLWDELAKLSGTELDKIIAYGVALSVSLSEKHDGLTGKFLAALDFDVTQHFTPTAENYLGKVSKPLIIEALKEAGKLNGEADKTALLAMKKGALATLAEMRLAGSGWVPSVIRAPKPKKPAANKTQAAQAKKPSKAKPASKAKSKTKKPAQAAA